MLSGGVSRHEVCRPRSSKGSIWKSVQSSSIKARYAVMAATAFGGSPTDFERLIVEDREKWANWEILGRQGEDPED